MARAMQMRCSWPPENAWGLRCAASGSTPTASRAVVTRAAISLVTESASVHRLGQAPSHRVGGVERAQGVLVDGLQLRPKLPSAGGGETDDLIAAEAHTACQNGHQQLGAARDGERDVGALRHAARQFVGIRGHHPLRLRELDLLEQLHRASRGCPSRHRLVTADDFAQMTADRVGRVQTRQRVLRDVSNAAAPNGAVRVGIVGIQAIATEVNGSGRCLNSRRQQPHHSQRGEALAAARLADQRHRLPPLD